MVKRPNHIWSIRDSDLSSTIEFEEHWSKMKWPRKLDSFINMMDMKTYGFCCLNCFIISLRYAIWFWRTNKYYTILKLPDEQHI